MSAVTIHIWESEKIGLGAGEAGKPDPIDAHLVESLVVAGIKEHRRAEVAKSSMENLIGILERYERQLEVQKACEANPEISENPLRAETQRHVVESIERAIEEHRSMLAFEQGRLKAAQNALTAIVEHLNEKLYSAFDGPEWDATWTRLAGEVEAQTDHDIREVLSW